MAGPYYVGIEVGGTKLQVVAGDARLHLVDRLRTSVDPSRGGAGIRATLETALPGFVEKWQPQRMGVGFGGPVDWRTGKICCSHQIEGWSEFDLADWLRTLTGCAVTAENDANTAALGEALHGAGRGRNPVFYVTLGSGVGGGLVVDGQIYHGLTPGEAEIGHIRLDRAGTVVEERCSGWAVDARIRALIASRPESRLGQLAAGVQRSEARILPAALAEGDPLAERLLGELAADLAFALSHVTHLIHPEVIVLGGGLSLVGEPLRLAVAQALPDLLMTAFRPGPVMALAALGEDAVTIGALELARREPQAGSSVGTDRS